MSRKCNLRRSARLALWDSARRATDSPVIQETSASSPSSILKAATRIPVASVQDASISAPQPADEISIPNSHTGPALCPEQEDLVNTVLSGKNVFYTGSAGCGKSTVLKAFVQQLRQMGKKVDIVAPTGRAALDVNGSTIHVYAGWRVGDDANPLEKLERGARRETVQQRLTSTHVLVIDEISMVENLLFERLNAIMKSARSNDKPFGGVQIIVTGDFCQLPPIKPFAHCIECGTKLAPDQEHRPTTYECQDTKCRRRIFYDKDKWAFQSRAWAECNFAHVNLKTIHRQSDAVFVSILNKFRTGEGMSFQDVKLLLDHRSNAENAIELYPKREDVDRLNRDMVDKLQAATHTYKCVDHLKWRDEQADLHKMAKVASDGTLEALRDHRYGPKLELKKGMRVVLLQNLDLKAGLVNGSQGVILGFEGYKKEKMPVASYNKDRDMDEVLASGVPVLIGSHARYREKQIHRFIQNKDYKAWPIVQFGPKKHRVVRTIYADCTVNWYDADQSSMLSRTQIPLMPGYAITVHKAQGMSLSRVRINLENAFERSQLYVALSRARSLQGLKVVKLPKRPLALGNAEVLQFMNEHFGKETGERQPDS